MCDAYPRAVRVDPISHRTSALADAVRSCRLIAVLRRVEPRDRLIALLDELVGDGVHIFEITWDAVEPAADLAAARERLGDRGRVGAGTLRTADHVREAVEAGATFGVSPVLDPAVLEAAHDAGLPFIPGAYTPTEADAAWRAGATFVKLFPASSLGPSHVRELRGPLSEIETIATGGVDGSNAAAFLAAGATAVGVGSALVRMSSADRRELVASALR